MSPLALRRTVAVIDGRAKRDLAALWRRMESAAQAGEALHDILPALIDTYGMAAAAAAAEWYDGLRDKAGARGRFTADPARIADTGAHALVGWALTTATDDVAFRALVEGGTQRRIANFARFTVADSAIADPAASGWIRVGAGECDWCQQYLDGEVRTVPGYDFPAHDNCNCSVTPAF